jgi:3-deoxy-7-phosphoheptulonate synthase
MQKDWKPDSWRTLEAFQQPDYEDPGRLVEVLDRLRGYPPIVVADEIEDLKERIAKAGRAEAFILQGGNCAERFLDCNHESIANKLRILLQMSVILTYGVRKPVVRIGRLAGQYAKPRTESFETIDGKRIFSYRGDAVHSVEATESARRPDPTRLLDSYFHSVATLNHVRALTVSGFADLHDPHNWDLASVKKSEKWIPYKQIVDRILDAIGFMESFGGVRSDALGRIDLFSSHEGLLLGYEEALTRFNEKSGRYYNQGAHMLWLGKRTRSIDCGHVEYFRGIANPIGVKIDADCPPDELRALIEALNPDDEEGRLTLITRLGAERVEEALPNLIRAAKKTGRHVVWSCDPMHGNTVKVNGGVKTRDFDVILKELETSFQIHCAEGSHLAGVHFELTAEDVTECVGGAMELTEADLSRKYETYCDPRLNSSQSLEMAFLIARLVKDSERSESED